MTKDRERCDELMLLVVGNDRSAFSALYERFRGPVYGLALSILKNRSDAEDVMQNAFLQVWNKAETYRSGTDAGAWILKITRNLSMDCLRKRKAMTDITELTDSVPGADEPSLDGDRLLLDHLLKTLECDERQMVMLHAWGYTHKEIARILGRPAATIRWQYSRAIKKLQTFLKQEDSYEQKAQYPTGF